MWENIGTQTVIHHGRKTSIYLYCHNVVALVTFSLAGPNRTRRQAELVISGAEIKFHLANSPLHTKRAAGCNNRAQKRDLATNLGEGGGEKKKRHPNIPERKTVNATMPFVTLNSCSTYKTTNA